MISRLVALLVGLFCCSLVVAQETKVSFFDVHVTPRIGSPVAYAYTRSVTDSLRAKGAVLEVDGQPVVLCAVDFIGISNQGLQAWREALALAAGTTVDRVSIHALHQHDAPRCDFTIEELLEREGLGGRSFDNPFLVRAIQRSAKAVNEAAARMRAVTHIGTGMARVDSVASNRRMADEQGVIHTRYSSTTDPAMMAAPEGLIDPYVRCLSFYDQDELLGIFTFYTTHPQSYYGQGDVTCEFVGIAREQFQQQAGVPVVHFNGASGNIACGKYNNGSYEARLALTARLNQGMRAAWQATVRKTIAVGSVSWQHRWLKLPVSENYDQAHLYRILKDTAQVYPYRFRAAEKLAWLQRSAAGKAAVNIASLRIGEAWFLSLPGELFVEYQLFAQQQRPGEFVCTAAYAEYGPGYIGTARSYAEKGGYETSDFVSGTSPRVEHVLEEAIRAVLQ